MMGNRKVPRVKKRRKNKKRMELVGNSSATVQQQLATQNQVPPSNDIATDETPNIDIADNDPGRYVRMLQNDPLQANAQPYVMLPRSSKGKLVASFFTDFKQLNAGTTTKAQAVCKLCLDLNGNRNLISFKKGVNSNLIRHMQRVRYLD